jgi:hypothetical protein
MGIESITERIAVGSIRHYYYRVVSERGRPGSGSAWQCNYRNRVAAELVLHQSEVKSWCYRNSVRPGTRE